PRSQTPRCTSRPRRDSVDGWPDTLAAMRFDSVAPRRSARRCCAHKFEIPFHQDRSHNVPRLASFVCASSTLLLERRYSVSSLRSRPATSSNLFGGVDQWPDLRCPPRGERNWRLAPQAGFEPATLRLTAITVPGH